MKSINTKHENDQSNLWSRKKFLVTGGLLGGYLLSRPFNSVLANTRSSLDDTQWPLKIEGDQLMIPSGNYFSEVQTFIVKKERRFHINPTTIKKVIDEELFLSADKPSGYWTGTPLKATRVAQLDIYYSLIEKTLVIKDAAGNLLKKGSDYLVSAPFALVGLGTDTKLTTQDKVYASYSYFLQRIDSVALDNFGIPFLIEGEPSLVCPHIPDIPHEAIRFCNIYRPIGISTLEKDHLFPILSDKKQIPVTGTTKGRINKTLKKLRTGEPITIVAWGDSITAGGDVGGKGWPTIFLGVLKERFPKAHINFKNYSIGGTRSMQWLHDGKYPGMEQIDSKVCSFKLVTDEKPDLVVMEFGNDAVEDSGIYNENYQIIKKAMDNLDCELIIHTPSMFAIDLPEVNVANMRKPDKRAYVSFVKQFADENNFGISDVAARWEHFYKEGLPYLAILINGYNHPNLYGHAIFVEELMKCFDENYQTDLPEYL